MPLPNIPIVPIENDIQQMSLVDAINTADSFFINIASYSVEEIKNLLLTIRRIFDGRCTSVLREEALNLYEALGLTSIADLSTAQQWDLVIAIADYYVYRSANP